MKINEFIEVMNSAKNKSLKTEQKQELTKKTLEVKNYLSIKDKKQLVQDIVDECVLYEGGVFKFDEIEKQAVKDTAKEILTELLHVSFETKCTVSNYKKSKEDIEIVAKAILTAIKDKIKEIAKRKGVEVE